MDWPLQTATLLKQCEIILTEKRIKKQLCVCTFHHQQPTADTVETGCQSQYKKTDGENRLEMVHKKYKENLATEW